jgi:hypothetical protein
MIHQNQRTLILNSTFHPLSVVSYKRAIALIYSKKINSLKDSDVLIKSEKQEIYLIFFNLFIYFFF